MESSCSSPNSIGPRPLATKPEYVRRSHTSKSGLLSSSITPNAALSNANSTPHELDHFSFKRPISDSLLQPNAKRARKLYRSVLHDQMFLMDLKEMWQTKLKKLQMEQVLLEQMCAYTQEDVNDVPPLFSQNDSTPLSNHQNKYQDHQRQSSFLQGKHRLEMRQQPQPQMQRHDHHDDSYSLNLLTPISSAPPESSPSSPQSSVYLTADDLNSETNSVADSFYLSLSRSDRDKSRNSPISASAAPPAPPPAAAATTATAEIEATSMNNDGSDQQPEENGDNDSDTNNSISNDLLDLVDSGNDSNDEDNVEEEDEETARRALTFMLAHYGNDL